MSQRNHMSRIAAAIVAGALLGALAAHALFLGWWTLVPWGLAGIVLGIRISHRHAIVPGIVYGFVLVFVFLAAGYTGDRSLLSRLPFFALFGLFGSLCGMVLTLAGSLI